MRTVAYQVTIRKKGARHWVIKLGSSLLLQKSFVIQIQKKGLSLSVVYFVRGSGKMGEHYSQTFEGSVNDFEISVHQFPGAYPFFAGLQGNRHPVLVSSAD
jgi:hypothetical protein